MPLTTTLITLQSQSCPPTGRLRAALRGEDHHARPPHVAGQGEETVEAHSSALEVYPRLVSPVQSLARHTLLAGLKDERQVAWLNMIAVEGEAQE